MNLYSKENIMTEEQKEQMAEIPFETVNSNSETKTL